MAQDETQDATEDTSRDESQDALPALLEAKVETIAALREQLEYANERDRENRRIIAALTSRIPAIEAPQEPQEASETVQRETPFTSEERSQEPPRRRGFWELLFGTPDE